MFNQFVLQPSYKIKASNSAMWPGNPFFTTEKCSTSQPSVSNPCAIYTHVPWGIQQINATPLLFGVRKVLSARVRSSR